MPQGTIKKLTDKGFGFIEGERGDIFFHHSSVEGTTYEALHEGQVVEYQEGQGPKGPRADVATTSALTQNADPLVLQQTSGLSQILLEYSIDLFGFSGPHSNWK